MHPRLCRTAAGVRLAFTACVLCTPVVARGEGEASETVKPSSPAAAAAAAGKGTKPLNAKHERLILEFARTHHPELAELLEKLKQADPPEYARAMEDLRPAQQRLLRLQEREPEQYPVELALWKVESRIRLLTAQMAMEADESLEESLKPLLAERRELKLQTLQYERKRVADRLASVDRQLDELQQPAETYTAKELKRLRQSVARHPKPGKGKLRTAKQKAREAVEQQKKAEKKANQREQKRDAANGDRDKDGRSENNERSDKP